MIRHTEDVAKLGEASLELDEDAGFHYVTIPYTTSGGVHKVLRVAEGLASALLSSLSDTMDSRPMDGRADRLRASLRA